jgi:hypothetical protein
MRYQVCVPASSVLWLLAIVTILPAIVAAGILKGLQQPSGLSLFLLAAMTVVALIISAGLWLRGAGIVAIDSHTIVASAATYRFQGQRDELIPDGIQIFPSLREAGVGFRRNGIGLPGYRVGWFSITLDGAPRRAFLLATSSPFLRVPFKNGEVLLVSGPSGRSQQSLSLGALKRALHGVPSG